MLQDPIIALSALMLCIGCKGEAPTPGQRSEDHGTERWTGLEPDQGFGSSVAISAHGLWAGAPHGEQASIYCLAEDGAELVIQGEGRLGSSLVPWQESFVAGAPLAEDGAGHLLSGQGVVLASGPASLGLALATDGNGWIAAHASGWLNSNGESGASTSRPSAVARRGSTTALGSALGSSPLLLSDVEIERSEPLDFAGYSLAVGDLDADGFSEWVLGAPGMDRVEIRSLDGALEATLQGQGGRFGASLAVGDLTGDGCPELIVGAPAAGQDVQGAVHVYKCGSLEPIASWEGEASGDQMGTSIDVFDGSLLIGIPGSAEGLGSAWRVRLEL